jgi:hypothetical protein
MKMYRPVRSGEAEALAAALGVRKVYDATEPLWYLRLTARFRLTWRRELATLVAVFFVGVGLGFAVARR